MNRIICERRSYEDISVTHCHDYSQLILPMNGILDIETDNTKLNLNKENLFFLPTDCNHICKSNIPNEALVLDIPNEFLSLYKLNNRVSNKGICKFYGGTKYTLDETWKAIRFLLLKELSSNNTEGIIRLFHYFYPMILKENTPSSIEYIHKHFNEKIELQTLANIEHYNITYYSEWFKNLMDVSPIEYIQSLRINNAKELLRDTDLNIISIAYEVGYNCNSSFTRIFKYYEKMSPSAYRSKVRQICKSYKCV